MIDWVFTCQSLVNWYYNVTFVGGIVLNNLSNVSFNESSSNVFITIEQPKLIRNIRV